MTTSAEQSRARDILLGVLYGDCLGAPYEFSSGPVTGPITVGPSVFGHPAGRGTDDTETTVAVAEGLIDAAHDRRSVDAAVADRLVAWLDGNPPDVGHTTAVGLRTYRRTGDPHAGATADNSVANGSLMRSAPFALVGDRGIELGVSSSRCTHAHPQVLDCVRIYLQVLRQLITGREVTVESGDLDLHPATDPADIPCAGIGHAIYALDLAVWAGTRAQDFATGLETIIRLGGDTDTNGAICGAVLGARFGFPERLRGSLDPDRVEELTGLAGRLVTIDQPE
jgi:ADP-ribosyl-[dinitrogen reductase] hydrolase